MKQILLFISSFFLFSGCSNMEIGFDKDSPLYNGGVVYIYLDENASSETQYHVYINNEDSEVTLIPGEKARFGVDPDEVEIEVVRGSKSATMELNLEASKDYYLKVVDSHSGNLEIVELPKGDLKSSQKSDVDEIEDGEETEFYYDRDE